MTSVHLHIVMSKLKLYTVQSMVKCMCVFFILCLIEVTEATSAEEEPS